MMKTQGHPWIQRAALLVALVCVCAWAAGTHRRLQDTVEVAVMTKEMKTVCVGRYLVDVPTQADVSLSGVMLGGFEVDTREESEAEFQKRIAARVSQLSAGSGKAGPNSPGGVIQTRVLRIPNMTGRTFVFGRTRSHRFEGGRDLTSEYVSVETHAHVGGLSVLLSMQYADEADVRSSEALLSRLQIMGKGEIPLAPGFCVGRADFTEPLSIRGNEQLVLHLGLRGHPDVAMALFSIADAKPGPGILARTTGVDSEARADELLRVTKLRTGKRSINGIDGEEVLERVREFNFTSTYGFNWETRGIEKNPLRPYLSFELQTGISERPGGKPVDSSLHEDALLVLWDSIASSIRLHKPVTNPPSPHPNSPTLAAH
jgi:hypothetical protein